MRILGLDVGEKRIGVAICDPQERLALPLTTLHRNDDASTLAAIADIAGREGVEEVLVGLPRSLDGSLGHQARQVEAFAEALAQRMAIPITRWDERLSTAEAERRLRAAGYSHRALRERRDAAAAAIVLQSYLDRRRGPTRD
ncbi:MAG: Holliday junction resolvase RuvX [Dehalococcoidia bacterium]